MDPLAMVLAAFPDDESVQEWKGYSAAVQVSAQPQLITSAGVVVYGMTEYDGTDRMNTRVVFDVVVGEPVQSAGRPILQLSRDFTLRTGALVQQFIAAAV